MTEKIICRVLTGPTASGKTGIGVQIAKAEGWEIACMDSMQVYRRMNIGTAKPTPEERRRIVHHLIDIAGIDVSSLLSKVSGVVLQVL